MYARLSSVGIEISASYGGNIPTRSESTTIENSDVVISTPEKFEALCQVVPGFIDRFDVLICDEGHLIDDGNRGLQYELLLTKFKRRDRPVDKIVFISAILPNVSDINDWLGGDEDSLITSDYKPVVTDYSFVRGVQDKWFLDFNPHLDQPYSYFLSDFIQKDELKFTNQATGNSNLLPGWSSFLTLACASAFKASIAGSVILFTTEKGGSGVKGLANKCLDMLDKNAFITQQYSGSNPPTDLVDYISMLLGGDHLLARLVRRKIGYHHGDLPQELRREMEQAINDQKINILICTSTLAEGVNLPIRTIVLHTIKRFNGRIKGYIEKRNIKNIIGRAGRAGKETRGRVIFANETERDYALDVINDIDLEPARGFLFYLIKALKKYLDDQNLTLNQEFFDSEVATNISYIFESIDVSFTNVT
jgi:helicase